jgi:hypothetical protein
MVVILEAWLASGTHRSPSAASEAVFVFIFFLNFGVTIYSCRETQSTLSASLYF